MLKTKSDSFDQIIEVLTLLLGIILFFCRENAITFFIYVLGVLLLFKSISDFRFYFNYKEQILYGAEISLILGIFDIALGLVLFRVTYMEEWIFSVILPVWFIVNCIFQILSVDISRSFYKGHCLILLMLNTIGVILGMLLIFNAWVSIFIGTYYTGFYLVLMGTGKMIIRYGELIKQ